MNIFHSIVFCIYEILPTVLSRASAHERLQLMQEKPGMHECLHGGALSTIRPTIVAVLPGNFPTAVL